MIGLLRIPIVWNLVAALPKLALGILIGGSLSIFAVNPSAKAKSSPLRRLCLFFLLASSELGNLKTGIFGGLDSGVGDGEGDGLGLLDLDRERLRLGLLLNDGERDILLLKEGLIEGDTLLDGLLDILLLNDGERLRLGLLLNDVLLDRVGLGLNIVLDITGLLDGVGDILETFKVVADVSLGLKEATSILGALDPVSSFISPSTTFLCSEVNPFSKNLSMFLFICAPSSLSEGNKRYDFNWAIPLDCMINPA